MSNKPNEGWSCKRSHSIRTLTSLTSLRNRRIYLHQFRTAPTRRAETAQGISKRSGGDGTPDTPRRQPTRPNPTPRKFAGSDSSSLLMSSPSHAHARASDSSARAACRALRRPSSRRRCACCQPAVGRPSRICSRAVHRPGGRRVVQPVPSRRRPSLRGGVCESDSDPEQPNPQLATVARLGPGAGGIRAGSRSAAGVGAKPRRGGCMGARFNSPPCSQSRFA